MLYFIDRNNEKTGTTKGQRPHGLVDVKRFFKHRHYSEHVTKLHVTCAFNALPNRVVDLIEQGANSKESNLLVVIKDTGHDFIPQPQVEFITEIGIRAFVIVELHAVSGVLLS